MRTPWELLHLTIWQVDTSHRYLICVPLIFTPYFLIQEKDQRPRNGELMAPTFVPPLLHPLHPLASIKPAPWQKLINYSWISIYKKRLCVHPGHSAAQNSAKNGRFLFPSFIYPWVVLTLRSTKVRVGRVSCALLNISKCQGKKRNIFNHM